MSTIIGSLIGRFRIEELLGKGSMGEVYRGFDVLLGRQVALKVIGTQSSRPNPLSQARFLREAKTLSMLEHPNICRIYDLIESRDGQHLLVLELIRGATLRQVMENNELSFHKKLEICKTVAKVLAVTHESDIVHRDLKPDNIMIDQSGDLKILDFGLAFNESERDEPLPRQIQGKVSNVSLSPDLEFSQTISMVGPSSNIDSSKTSEGSIVGTLRYMSPEQARGEKAGPASDLYALGIIMQELFTGRPAYGTRKMNTMEMVTIVSMGQTEALDEEEIDPDLTRIIEGLTALDPKDRFSSEQTIKEIESVKSKYVTVQPKSHKLLGILMMFGLVMLGLVSYLLFKPKTIRLPENRQIALLPFSNQTEDPSLNWVQYGLSDITRNTLAQSAHAELVDDDLLAQFLRSHNKSLSADWQPSLVNKLRKWTGASWVVETTITRPDTRYNLSYRVVGANGEIKSQNIRGVNLMEMANMMAHELWLMASPDRAPAELSQVRDPFAQLAYARGAQILKTLGNREAEHFFRVAVTVDPDFLEAKFKLAQCLFHSGDIENAQRLLLSNQTEGSAQLEPAVAWNRFKLLAEIDSRLGHWENAKQALDSGLSFFSGKIPNKVLAEYNHALANVYLERDRLHLAESSFQHAYQLNMKADNLYEAARNLTRIAVVKNKARDYHQAMTFLVEALDLSEALEDVVNQAKIYLNLGVTAWYLNDYDAAEDFYQMAASLFKQQEMPTLEATVQSNLAGLAWQRGDLALAERKLSECLTIYENVKSAEGIARTARNLASLLIDQDRVEEASYYIEESLSWYENNPGMMMLKARYEYKCGHFDEAARWATGSLNVPESEPRPIYQEVAKIMQQAAREERELSLPEL